MTSGSALQHYGRSQERLHGRSHAFDCRSPRKLSGTSVASFASSFQDYCRKFSNSSVGAGSSVGDATNPPISPTTAIPFSAGAAVSSAAAAGVAGCNRGGAYGAVGGAKVKWEERRDELWAAVGVAVRKFSDPNDYGHHRRKSIGGGGKAPLFFELDRAGGLRRLASTSLERYRPYMSRLSPQLLLNASIWVGGYVVQS